MSRHSRYKNKKKAGQFHTHFETVDIVGQVWFTDSEDSQAIGLETWGSSLRDRRDRYKWA